MVLKMKEELGAWYPVVESYLRSRDGIALGMRLGQDEKRLQPELPRVFRALRITQPQDVKVVILGQDPYPKGHADGLAFSSGISNVPHSLGMIFGELNKIGIMRTNPSLEDWAKQGVLLLNTALTTIWGKSNGHAGIGWRGFVDTVLMHTAKLTGTQPIAYMAWGSFAKQKMEYILSEVTPANTMMFFTNHPAARDGYLFNAAPDFLLVNVFLRAHNVNPIKWSD